MSAQATHAQSMASGAPHREQALDDDSVLVDFFDRLGVALSTGDVAAIAAAWEAPALVVADGGAHAVSSTAEVEQFFAGARDQYLSRGITSTRAEIVRVTWVGARTALAEVRWPMLDERNRELGEERTTYTLRSDDEGELKIRVAITHSPAAH